MQKYYYVKAGDKVALKEWGPRTDYDSYGNRFKNRNLDALFNNTSGKDMFLPSNTAAERNAVYNNLGSVITRMGDSRGYILAPSVNDTAYGRMLPLWSTSATSIDTDGREYGLTVSSGYGVIRYYSNVGTYAQYADGTFAGCWSGTNHAGGPYNNVPSCPSGFTEDNYFEATNTTGWPSFGAGQEISWVGNEAQAITYHSNYTWQSYNILTWGCASPGFPYLDFAGRRCYVDISQSSYKFKYGINGPNELVIGVLDDMNSQVTWFEDFTLRTITNDGYYYPNYTWGTWDGTSALTVTILPKVAFRSSTQSGPAFTLNGTYPGGLTINNYGGIIGFGGGGGAGGAGYYNAPGDNSYGNAGAGGNGGTGVYCNTSSTVVWNNKLGVCGTQLPLVDNGYICGGGGGGGGGAVGNRGGGGGGGGGIGIYGANKPQGGAGGTFTVSGSPANGTAGAVGDYGFKYRWVLTSCLHFQAASNGTGGAGAGGGGAGGAGGVKGTAGTAGANSNISGFSGLYGQPGGAAGSMFQNKGSNITFNDCTPSYSAGAIN